MIINRRMTLGLLSAVLMVVLVAPLASQSTGMMKPTPSLSLSFSPNPPVLSQASTLRGTLNNVFLMSGTPQPKYRFKICKGVVADCLNATADILAERGYTTTNTLNFTPTTTGTHTVYGDAQIYKPDGSLSTTVVSNTTFEAKANNIMTWVSPIKAENYGSTPPAHLAGKTISDIVNSRVSGRTDSPTPKKCNECHHPTAAFSYRGSSGEITPSTSIRRSDVSSYRWNMSGTDGIVERFCASTVMGQGSKPTDLETLFRKWAADGYRAQ